MLQKPIIFMKLYISMIDTVIIIIYKIVKTLNIYIIANYKSDNNIDKFAGFIKSYKHNIGL